MPEVTRKEGSAEENGGPGAEKIEPIDPVEFLEAMEDWADVLGGEPEALRLLSAFSAEASDDPAEDNPADAPDYAAPPSVQPEPSP